MSGNSESCGDRTPLLQNGSSHHGANQNGSHLSPAVLLRAKIVSILVPIFISSVGTTQASLLAQYLVDRLGNEAGIVNKTQLNPCMPGANSTAYEAAEAIQTEATRYLTYYGFAQCVPAFFACFFVGSYSDYLGRRLLLGVVIFAAMSRMLVLTIVIGWTLDLNFLLLGFLIDGCAGSWFALLVVLYSITADITAEGGVKAKIFWILLINATSSFMQGATSLGNGYLIKMLGYFNASLFLSGLSLTAFIIALFLPETLKKHSVPRERQLNPFVHAKRMFGFYVLEGTLRRRATYCVAIFMFIFVAAGEMNASSLDALYQLHEPFCWSPQEIGIYQAVRNGATNALGVFYMRFCRLCLKDEIIAIVAVISQATAYAVEAFVQNTWEFYIVAALFLPFSPFFAIVRGLISHLATAEQQGAVFSSIAVVEALTQLSTVTAFNKLYGATNSSYAGLVFLVMAGCSIVGLGFLIAFSCIRDSVAPNDVRSTIHIQDPDDVASQKGIEKSGRVYCRTSID